MGVLETLSKGPEGVTREILGDFEDCGWGLQKISVEECGRASEEMNLQSQVQELL